MHAWQIQIGSGSRARHRRFAVRKQRKYLLVPALLPHVQLQPSAAHAAAAQHSARRMRNSLQKSSGTAAGSSMHVIYLQSSDGDAMSRGGGQKSRAGAIPSASGSAAAAASAQRLRSEPPTTWPFDPSSPARRLIVRRPKRRSRTRALVQGYLLLLFQNIELFIH